jgi:hypothetical protein
MRCAERDGGKEQDAAPGADVKDPGPVVGERGEMPGSAPPFKANQRKSCCWVQSRAKRLARVDRDDRVARGGNVLTPWGAHDDATDTQDREFGAPTRCPLFGGDWSHQQWPNAAQSNTATRKCGEALELGDECIGGGAVACGVGEPGANADRCIRIVDRPKRIAVNRWWRSGLGAGTRRGEASESFANCLGGFGVARNAEFEPTVGAQR